MVERIRLTSGSDMLTIGSITVDEIARLDELRRSAAAARGAEAAALAAGNVCGSGCGPQGSGCPGEPAGNVCGSNCS